MFLDLEYLVISCALIRLHTFDGKHLLCRTSRSKFLSDKWMVEKGFLREEDLMVTKPW